MPNIPASHRPPNGSTEPFAGFALPTSNTIYTPNQFFDVCLRHHSRGVLRLVAYMIRQTLGWCDAQGNPVHEVVAISYKDLERHAGVGHSMIRLALDEAERGGFITCVQKGRASRADSTGAAASYELTWDDRDQYVKAPEGFRGFFAGEGNRTYIPNQFFDRVIPNEPLATIQVVGTIIRFSIGFVNRYGHRRQRVALSYRDIQRYARISSPRVLSKAIREAIAKNYIERVEEGYFDPNGGALSRSAHYAVKWAQLSPLPATTPKSEAASGHTKKVSGVTPKSEAAKHTDKVSGIQITETNNILKQQPGVVVAFEKLKAEGFDDRAAGAIVGRYPADRIERQIGWIGLRRIKSNRLGMLRAAIEQDWAPPETSAGRVRGLESATADSEPPRPSGGDFLTTVEKTRHRLLDRDLSITTTP